MMKVTLFTLAGALALSLPLTSVVNADDYTNRVGGFRLSLPKGWEVAKDEQPKTEDMNGAVLVSPRVKDTMGLCPVMGSPDEETKNFDQAKINTARAGSFSGKEWSELLSSSGFEKLTLENSGDDILNGHISHYAVATYDESGERMKVRVNLHFSPGQFFLIMCAAKKAGFSSDEADILSINKSLTPLGAAVVASGPVSALHASAPAGRRRLLAITADARKKLRGRK